ncbi:MAG TPA: transposase, partial [Pirellulales bacterium]|nr:transposase [Pirellulales bacterium]
FGEALSYLRNHWDALQTFVSDGRMPIDNNDVEQLMKQIAVGRKNWLFVGSLEAGARAATLMTIVSTAARNDLDVYVYLKDVLDQLLAGSTDYRSLHADVWKQSHPEAVRNYRTDERRDAADRRRRRRAQRRLAQNSPDPRP